MFADLKNRKKNLHSLQHTIPIHTGTHRACKTTFSQYSEKVSHYQYFGTLFWTWGIIKMARGQLLEFHHS